MSGSEFEAQVALHTVEEKVTGIAHILKRKQNRSGTKTIKLFCHYLTAIKLRQDFDALFWTLNGFASVNLHHQDESVLIFSSKYVHLKTH